jgi:hypothetical protein
VRRSTRSAAALGQVVVRLARPCLRSDPVNHPVTMCLLPRSVRGTISSAPQARLSASTDSSPGPPMSTPARLPISGARQCCGRWSEAHYRSGLTHGHRSTGRVSPQHRGGGLDFQSAGRRVRGELIRRAPTCGGRSTALRDRGQRESAGPSKMRRAARAPDREPLSSGRERDRFGAIVTRHLRKVS